MNRRHFALWVSLMMALVVFALCDGNPVYGLCLLPAGIVLREPLVHRHPGKTLVVMAGFVGLFGALALARFAFPPVHKPAFPAFVATPPPPMGIPHFVYVAEATLLLLMTGLALIIGYSSWRHPRQEIPVQPAARPTATLS